MMGREHWVEISLGSIVLHRKGKKPNTLIPEKKENYLPYILIDELEGNIPKLYADSTNMPIAKKSDVLLVWDGSIGKCASGIEGIIGSTLVALTPLGSIPTKFLEYIIINANRFIKETSTGTGLQHINKNFLNECIILLPPLNEQKRIVEKLDAILPRVKSAKARLSKISAILKKFRQRVLAAACSGRLTEDWREGKDLPEWSKAKFKDVGTIGRGKSKHRPRNDPKLFNGKYPFIQTGDVAQSNGYITSYNQTYSESGLAQSKLWPSNTLCITIAANIANTSILTFPACFPDSVVGFIPDKAKSELLFIKWVVDTIKNDLENYAPATAQKNINLGILDEVEFDCPPLEEQQEIVRRVEKLFDLADALEAKYKKAFARVEKLEQAILAKAFRGELVEPDPNDEPAEKLLKRILEEKACLPARQAKLADKKMTRKPKVSKK